MTSGSDGPAQLGVQRLDGVAPQALSFGAVQRATMARGAEARAAMVAAADLRLAEAGVPNPPRHADISRSDLSQPLHQVLLDYWSSTLSHAGVRVARSRLAPFDAARLPVLDDDKCPYVGLESFRNSTFFFGRER